MVIKKITFLEELLPDTILDKHNGIVWVVFVFSNFTFVFVLFKITLFSVFRLRIRCRPLRLRRCPRRLRRCPRCLRRSRPRLRRTHLRSRLSCLRCPCCCPRRDHLHRRSLPLQRLPLRRCWSLPLPLRCPRRRLSQVYNQLVT